MDDLIISTALVGSQDFDHVAGQHQSQEEDQSLIKKNGAEIYKAPVALRTENDHGMLLPLVINKLINIVKDI